MIETLWVLSWLKTIIIILLSAATTYTCLILNEQKETALILALIGTVIVYLVLLIEGC